jgi:hypothetical protein
MVSVRIRIKLLSQGGAGSGFKSRSEIGPAIGYNDFNNLVLLLRHVYKKPFFRFIEPFVRVCLPSFEKVLKRLKKEEKTQYLVRLKKTQTFMLIDIC